MTGITIRIEFIRKYIQAVLYSTKRYIDLWGGRGRGGSHFATQYFLFKITSPQYFRGYFVRRTFADIRDSLFKDFKDRIEETPGVEVSDFHINENQMSIVYLPTGNEITSKGVQGDGKRTAKMKSLAGATHVLIEEAEELTEDEFDQLDLSLRTTKTERIQVLRVFNPPNLRHWIWRDYTLSESDQPGYFKATAKPESDVVSVFGTYRDNYLNINETTRTKFEAFKTKDPEYYHTIVMGLISEGAKGRIYNGWTPIDRKTYDDLQYPEYFALDWGFSNDPVAVIGVKFHNKSLWLRKIIYETGLTNDILAEKMNEAGVSDDDIIIADSAEPKSIMDLRASFPLVYGAIKGSIKSGINLVKSYDVHYVDDKYVEIEYMEYKWHIGVDKFPTDKPVDKHNHIMDAIRYLVEYIPHL